MIYDLIIIGGGPAGTAAGVYAARKQIKTLLVAESFGGQSIESNEIQNWIGTVAISGIGLAKNLKEHVKFYAGEFVEIKEGEKVTSVAKEAKESGFTVETNKNKYQTKTILIATGGSRRKLDVPGAKEFEGKGITYCASCDGPFFTGKDVAVIGGGNAGFETAAQLLAYCKSVTLLEKDGGFRGDPVTVEKVLSNPKMKAFYGIDLLEIKGGKTVKSLNYKDRNTGENIESKVEGIFVEIGHMPATSFIENLVDLDEFKRIKIDHRTQRTGTEGIWAAGDCTDTLYHQNNIAAGDAIKALEDIYLGLQGIK